MTIARPFNTYGPRQSARAVIPTIIARIAAGTIFTNHKSRFDPIHTIFPRPEAREQQLIDVPVNVPVNVPVSERQAWFMAQLRKGRNCKAADLAAQWRIMDKTGKRDIADLKKKG